MLSPTQGVYSFLFIESVSFGLKVAGSPLCLSTEALCHCYKNISLLICTASAFSERYLGMPLRDDSRYQVRVFCLPALVCRWSLKSVTPLPTVKLSQLLNVAAIKVRSSDAFPFSSVCVCVFFLYSVGFCHSSLFDNQARRCVRSHAGDFFFFFFLPGSFRPPTQTNCLAIRGVFRSEVEQKSFCASTLEK